MPIDRLGELMDLISGKDDIVYMVLFRKGGGDCVAAMEGILAALEENYTGVKHEGKGIVFTTVQRTQDLIRMFDKVFGKGYHIEEECPVVVRAHGWEDIKQISLKGINIAEAIKADIESLLHPGQ